MCQKKQTKLVTLTYSNPLVLHTSSHHQYRVTQVQQEVEAVEEGGIGVMEAMSSMEVVRGVEVELLEGVDGEVVEGSVEEVIEGVEEGGI